MVFSADLRASDDNIAKKIVLNDNEANGSSNKQQLTDREKTHESDTAANVLHVQAILERMPLAILHMIMADNKPSSLNDILSYSIWVIVVTIRVCCQTILSVTPHMVES